MARVHILVEGQTEETFVREILAPHLRDRSIYATAVLVSTKRAKSGQKFKGGVTTYARLRNDILRLLRDSAAVCVTTMIDYYALPTDFPEFANRPAGDCYARVSHLHNAFAADIADSRFLPFITLHEFEALLFADPLTIATAFPEQSVADSLLQIRARFGSPEEIDDGEQTHPAARLTRLMNRYQKTLHGPLIAQRIGLDAMRRECPHFNRWVEKLEALL